VVFDGRYGEPGHRRQRYRCYPDGKPGGEFHRFTEPMPRQVTLAGVCTECERGVHPSEGPQTPRQYEFSARDVGHALVAVGAGESYRAAAAKTRRDAERFPIKQDGERHYSRHGQLVGDWVELFAPVVFEPHRRWEWPEHHSLVLDHLGFRLSDSHPDGRPKTGPVAFNVLAAFGYEDNHWVLWHLASSPTVLADDWEDFLAPLDGAPRRVVTDGHGGTIAAARRQWPQAELYRSEWHLQKALYDALVKDNQHGDTRLHRALRPALINRNHWDQFCVVAHRTGSRAVNGWIDRYGPIVTEQFGRRPSDEARRRGNPTTTSILEPRLERIKAWVTPRTRALGNRARFDRLLMPMQLHLNEQANVAAYTHAIRDWLLINEGRPAATRRIIADDKHHPSLKLQGRPQRAPTALTGAPRTPSYLTGKRCSGSSYLGSSDVVERGRVPNS
jgi:hypothetical protein